MAMAKRNAFYAQSGGVTAVINASACGVIQTARMHPDAIGTVYAGRNGIIGALTEDLIDTGHEPDDAIAGSKRGGAICAPRPRLTTQLVRLGSRRGQTPSSTAMVSNGSGSMAKPQSSRRTSLR